MEFRRVLFRSQHAEKADAEAKAQRRRILRFELQRRIVEAQLLQGLAEVLEILGIDREHAGEHAWLHLAATRQHLDAGIAGEAQRVTARRPENESAERRVWREGDSTDNSR